MKESKFTNYDELPLFLSAKLVALTLGVGRATAYELMNEKDFPAIRVGSRIVVPKEKFRQWVEPVSYTHLDVYKRQESA